MTRVMLLDDQQMVADQLHGVYHCQDIARTLIHLAVKIRLVHFTSHLNFHCAKIKTDENCQQLQNE